MSVLPSRFRQIFQFDSLRVVAAFVLLFGVAIFFFGRGLYTETESHYWVLDRLRIASQLDHKINEAVMTEHSFRPENTNLIAEAAAQTKHICEELKASTVLPGHSQIREALNHYCEFSAIRISQAEKFKALNFKLESVLQEIPQLIEEIQNQKIRQNALLIFQETVLYQLLPVKERREKVETNLHQFAKAKSVVALPFLKTMTDTLRMIDQRMALEAMILSPEVDQSLFQVRELYVQKHQAGEKRALLYRICLIGLCGILVGGLWFVLRRWQQTARNFSALNQTLEKRVNDRTEELSTALAELNRQQLALTQKTKMSALGEMAGGIAHEINTPLAAISLNIELLNVEAEQRGLPEFQKSLQAVVRIVDRISKIVMGLRRFARDGSQEPRRPLMISEVIEDTLILCRERFKTHGVEIKVSLEDPEALISCTPEQIAQVLMNLLNNGFDAVAKLQHKWLRIETSSKDDILSLRVSDSGPGIPPEIQAKLMEPFFTTKEIGKGTGLGLSISKGIIESHGGRMTYDAAASTTTFLIELPQFRTESLVA